MEIYQRHGLVGLIQAVNVVPHFDHKPIYMIISVKKRKGASVVNWDTSMKEEGA